MKLAQIILLQRATEGYWGMAKRDSVLECASPLWTLHASRKAHRFSANPGGIQSQSPGLRGTSYPGKRSKLFSTLKGLRPTVARWMQPLQGWGIFLPLTQGSSFLATLGWMTQSLWDWPLRAAYKEQSTPKPGGLRRFMERTLCLIIIVGCSLIVHAQESSGKASRKSGRDSLTFKNGDVLFGLLNAIDSTNGITWNRSDALDEFRFRPDRITQLDFSTAAVPPQKTSSNLCSVQLTNGDQFQGDLVSYDGEKLKLDTWFGGELQFPKETVALVVPLGLPRPTIFSGPTGLEGWTIGKVNAAGLLETGEWVYQNGAFYAFKSASIARDVHLPESTSVQFDIEWR